LELTLGQWLVIGGCALLILGYIWGFYHNRQQAGRILAWLYEGLRTLGPVTAGEKLPGMATGGRLEVRQAAPPFRRLEAVYLMAPRENPLYWLFSRLQGKGDELILWVTFQSKPGLVLEVGRRDDKSLQNRLGATNKTPLIPSDGPGGLVIAGETGQDPVLDDKVMPFLERYAAVINRLALREDKPHLFLKTSLKIMKTGPATDLLSALSQLAKPSG
jgi:hypothetical protein